MTVHTPDAVARGTPIGAWRGTYTCLQGLTALDLSIRQAGHGRLKAVFRFGPLPSNPSTPTGCYVLAGTIDSASRHIVLRPRTWLDHPPGFVMVGMEGDLDSSTVLRGRIVDNPFCSTFNLKRDTAPTMAATACDPPAVA